jgi:hypothetical protein
MKLGNSLPSSSQSKTAGTFTGGKIMVNKKDNDKEKSPDINRADKKLNLFSNKSITDRLEFVNILFKDLSGFTPLYKF